MEYAYEDQPEGDDAGEVQALGGGVQIYSIEKDFPKPQVQQARTQQSTAKAKGKGKFKPRQTQHVNTFQQRQSTAHLN